MNNSQLRAFHAVALYGGFSKAADRLGLTQPAISDQVKKLEEHFGVLLFHRHKRIVKLTPLGEQLFEITKRKYQLEDQAKDLLSAHQVLEKGSLTIASDTPLHVFPLIAQFKQKYPGINIRVSFANSEQIISGLTEFTYDLGIIADMEPDKRYHSIKISEYPLVAFVSKKHDLARRDSVTLREISRYPLVLRERGSRTRWLVEEEFEKAALPFKTGVEVQGREACREAVAAEIGVGLVIKPEFGFDERLIALPISDCDSVMTESIVCLREKMELQVVQAFFKSNNLPLLKNTPSADLEAS